LLPSGCGRSTRCSPSNLLTLFTPECYTCLPRCISLWRWEGRWSNGHSARTIDLIVGCGECTGTCVTFWTGDMRYSPSREFGPHLGSSCSCF
jgi:hypothetical protein